jgi:DMSO/TMAO reductase YedYZ molybdopterin-dependent catalytic subunit
MAQRGQEVSNGIGRFGASQGATAPGRAGNRGGAHPSRAVAHSQVARLIERELSLDWTECTALPRVTLTSDIHCVTRWSKLDNLWEGPSGKTVLERAEPLTSASFVLVHAPGYTANLPVEVLKDDDVLFALKHDGEELTPEHGYPVRLVVPSRYFWKSVKWVTGLEFIAHDEPGFWEQRGYHNEGDPYREERFSI